MNFSALKIDFFVYYILTAYQVSFFVTGSVAAQNNQINSANISMALRAKEHSSMIVKYKSLKNQV